MRVVLNTNVIVSALNFPGNERLVLELALRGRFELVLCRFILEEVAGVLTRKFDWDEERAAQVLQGIENAATVIDPPRLLELIAGGHADHRILESAVSANADYVVTGDRRHLLPLGEYQGARMINAPRILSALAEV